MSKIFHVAQQHNDTHVNFTLAELILIKQSWVLFNLSMKYKIMHTKHTFSLSVPSTLLENLIKTRLSLAVLLDIIPVSSLREYKQRWSLCSLA